MTRHRVIPWLATALVGMLSSPAVADCVNICADVGASTGHFATFTGTLDVHAAGPSTATVTFVLRNTDPTGNYLTGIALQNPGTITGVTLTSAPASFNLVGGPGFSLGVSAQPFGDFGFAATVGDDFLYGRKPVDGVPLDATATFVFTVTGSDVGAYTADSFLGATGDSPGKRVSPTGILVRFRGQNADKVPVMELKESVAVTPVPAPPALVLGLVGAAGLFGKRAWARRRTPIAA